MRKTLLISLILIEILVNEISLIYFSVDKSIGIENVSKIRFFNLIIFITILIIFFYYQNFVKLKFFYKITCLISFIVLIDVISGYVGFGYPKNESDSLRYVFPYDWIRGEPNKLDHNEFGFRGKSPDIKREKDKFIIGFFGGSTGYQGDPSIIEIVSKKLDENNLKNEVFNFSSVSSNHNQHLHRLLEFSEYKYDLIIFYGGGNETIQSYYYDSRPGYPFNFYIYENDPFSILNIFMRYSNIIGEVDKIFKIYLDFNPKTSNDDNFDIWIDQTKKNYLKTLQKAKNLSENLILPNKCKKTHFLPIFQPLEPPDKRSGKLVEIVKKDLAKNNILNFTNLINDLTFVDFIHIDQKSKYLVAEEIYILSKKIFENKDLCKK